MILKYGDPALRKVCTPVEEFDSSLEDVVYQIAKTFVNERAFAVAATQVGLDKQVFVWAPDGHPEAVINPKVVEESEEQWKYPEGCLSLPGLDWYLDRPRYITVEYATPEGALVGRKMEDITTRIFQHELDHLQGVLVVDRLTPALRKQALRKLERAGLTETGLGGENNGRANGGGKRRGKDLPSAGKKRVKPGRNQLHRGGR